MNMSVHQQERRIIHMSLTKEDLRLIGELFDKKFEENFDERFDEKFDEKLKPVYDRLDRLEYKQDRTEKKVDNLHLDMKIMERDIKRDIHTLQDQTETVIEVLKQNDLLPA